MVYLSSPVLARVLTWWPSGPPSWVTGSETHKPRARAAHSASPPRGGLWQGALAPSWGTSPYVLGKRSLPFLHLFSAVLVRDPTCRCLRLLFRELSSRHHTNRDHPLLAGPRHTEPTCGSAYAGRAGEARFTSRASVRFIGCIAFRPCWLEIRRGGARVCCRVNSARGTTQTTTAHCRQGHVSLRKAAAACTSAKRRRLTVRPA